MIETEQGTLYTGITNNLPKRWQAHLSGKGAKYLRANKPKAIIYLEQHSNRSEASKREALLKNLTREQKEELVRESGGKSMGLLAELGLLHS